MVKARRKVSVPVLLLGAVSLLLILCTAPSATAQVLYGSLTGTVTDPSGAAIPKASVVAHNVQTGVSRKTVSDASGIYRFSALQPGVFEVSISASGFAARVISGVEVAANTVRRADAQLAVATARQEVSVTGAPPLLQTDKSDVHVDLSQQEVANLPSSGSQGRNFQALLQIIPGAGITEETNSLAGNPERAMNTNINGQSMQTINTRIDGVQDAYPYLPANVAYVPPSQAIQTVNVVTNSFDAEQGMAGGASVNVEIKSGTDQFHGSGEWFHTDQSLAAWNHFANPALPAYKTKARNNQNQIGGTFGGPIKKDKAFFFADFERTTQRNRAGPDVRNMPTAAMLAGDFQNLPGNPVSYDPATGTATGAGKLQISCNGVPNVICPGRIDPAAAKLAQLLQPAVQEEYPTANDLNNFAGTGTAMFNRNNADFKVDVDPTNRTTLFARYSFSKLLVYDPPLLGAAGGDATNGGQLGDAPGLIQSAGAGGTHTFTPSLLFDWNLGYTRQRLEATFDLGSPDGLDLLHIPGTNGAGVPAANDLYNGLPSFQINSASGSLNLGNPNTGNPYVFRDNQYVMDANLSWVHGAHSIRGGIEGNHTQLNHFQPEGGTFQTARGTFQFTGNVTSLPGSTPTWFNSVANFLLGLPSATGKAYLLNNPVALRWSQWAWYIRDQWQVRPKLTLNLGVRWEFYPFGYSDGGKGLRWLNTANGNVYIGGNGNVPQGDGVDVGSGQFLPRVGVAYRLTSSTVIRGGYGMSADPNNWRFFMNSYPAAVISANVVPNSSDYIAVASLTGTNAAGLGSGSYSVPTGLVNVPPPDTSSGVIPLPTNASTSTIPSPFHRGYLNSFNVTLEQNLKGFVFQAGYVATYDTRPLVNMNLNGSAPGTGAAGGVLSQALGKTFTGTINGLVPFQSNNYNSLQTTLKRTWRGSTFGFVWTWSKAMDYEDDEDLGSLMFPDPAEWQRNYAPAGFDRTHNVEIYGVQQLPFGKGQPWLTTGVPGAILGGWQLSPVVTIGTGFPFTVTANAGPLNSNGSGQTADQVGPYQLINGTVLETGQTCPATTASCHYFNPSAFAVPPAGQYGNTGRDEFRGPGYFNMNLSIARQFNITERLKLQLRGDIMGLTNTPHFNPPNATVGATNFGIITSQLKAPGEGFFGSDYGNRVAWLGIRLMF